MSKTGNIFPTQCTNEVGCSIQDDVELLESCWKCTHPANFLCSPVDDSNALECENMSIPTNPTYSCSYLANDAKCANGEEHYGSCY